MNKPGYIIIALDMTISAINSTDPYSAVLIDMHYFDSTFFTEMCIFTLTSIWASTFYVKLPDI